MKNNRFLLLFVGLFAHLCVAQQLNFGPKKENQGQLLDKIIAYVGTDTITQSELSALGATSTSNASAAQMLEELITQKLLIQAATKRNITVNDTMVDDAINRQAQTRNISRSTLISDLQARGINFADYRDQIRNQLTISTLQQAIGRSLVDISEREVNDVVAQQKNTGETITLSDIFIPLSANATKPQLQAKQTLAKKLYRTAKQSPETILALASNNVQVNRLGTVALSRIPASFQKALAQTQTGQVTQPIRDRDGIHILKVESRGQSQKNALNFTETQAKHILIRVEDEKAVADAKARIDDIARLLAHGESFESLASQYSEDTETASSGGSLGWVRPAQMVPEFERVMNSTDTKQISQPVRTQYGWHIIKVEARRKAQTDAKEQQRMAARASIFEQRIEEAWAMWVQRLREEGYVKIVK